MSPPELGRARPHLRAPGPAATQTHCARRRYRVRSPRTFTMSPSFTPRAHDARFTVPFRCRPWGLCARAPVAARGGMQQPSRADGTVYVHTAISRARARRTAYVHHVAELHAPRSQCSLQYSIHMSPPELARAGAYSSNSDPFRAGAVPHTFTMSPSFTRPVQMPPPELRPRPRRSLNGHAVETHNHFACGCGTMYVHHVPELRATR